MTFLAGLRYAYATRSSGRVSVPEVNRLHIYGQDIAIQNLRERATGGLHAVEQESQ